MENDPELKEYHGNCHCGLFKFKINIPKLTTVWTCNCSICSRNGYLWIFPVPENDLIIEAGTEKALHAYEFAMRGTKHLFCPECGSSLLARRHGAPADKSLRINARMLEGIDISALEVKRFSGADLSPKYEPPNNPLAAPKKEVELKLYHGNCHCGSFKYSVKIPELKRATTCNCSICSRKGYMWHVPVSDENLTIEKGDGMLKTYEFGNEEFIHLFCPTCGSAVMSKTQKLPRGRNIGINVRMLKDIDLSALEIKKSTGADREPKYIPPTIPPYVGDVEEDFRVYNGNCHCGAVTYTAKLKPLKGVTSCNCSLCSRNGELWTYPPASHVQLRGKEHLTGYAFLSENSLHSFCENCGVSVCVQVTGEDLMPINVRTVNGVDLDALERHYHDGKKNDPQYCV